MKKTLLLLCAMLFLGALNAQDCEQDSNLLITGALLSPAPYTPDSPYYNLATACIGLPYSQSVTVNIPATYQGFPIDSVSIQPSGAISNMPAGVSYVCEPPNCHFKSQTLGCILLNGTVSNSQLPDTLDLGITATVHISTIGIPVNFPGAAAPGAHYYLIVKTAADCMNAAGEANKQLGSVRNFPNPFNGLTTIEVSAISGGNFQFEVFNLLGKRIYAEPLRLDQGLNTFYFDAGDLQPGTYFYAIGNAAGKTTRRMTVN